MKKLLAMILGISLMLSTVCGFAESTVDTIMAAGTTQAFTDEAVPTEDIETILQAGLSATSAMNQQPWFLVALTDSEMMTTINESAGAMTPPEGFKPDNAQNSASAENAPAAENMAPAAGNIAKAGLGDSPLAIIIYKDNSTMSPDASFDCGLAAQNMYIAAVSLGYGVKIVSSTTNALNGEEHDALCEQLGVDPSLEAVAVLLIGKTDTDAVSSATVRKTMEEKTSIK